MKKMFKTPMQLSIVDDEMKIRDWRNKLILLSDKDEYDSSKMFYSIINQSKLSKFYAKAMNLIEGIGLPQKQESAVKQQLRDLTFVLTEDEYTISPQVLTELRAGGIPMGVWLRHQNE